MAGTADNALFRQEKPGQLVADKEKMRENGVVATIVGGRVVFGEV
jgi:hypothetical protein